MTLFLTFAIIFSMNKWKLSTIILGILIIGLASFLIKDYFFNEKVLTSQEAVKIGLDYINKYITDEANQASLEEISSDAPKSFYKFVISIANQKFSSYVSTDGKLLFPGDALKLDEVPSWAQETETELPLANTQESEIVNGNFTKLINAEICNENGKPIIYFFGSTSCPHCVWEHPIFEEVAQKFSDYISFHNNMDSQNDMDVFSKYSQGGVPTLVLGCKYYRVGSGEGVGEEKEKENLTKLFCDLTQNKPAEICK